MLRARHVPQDRYLKLVGDLEGLMLDPKLALSAAVYTEVCDVEAEINGILTYDRKVGVHGS